MAEHALMIDGWKCTELYPGTDWVGRYAVRGKEEWSADSSGLELRESSLGYCGGTGSYRLPANVAMWLMQAVR